jgi:hypothetical protein
LIIDLRKFISESIKTNLTKNCNDIQSESLEIKEKYMKLKKDDS